MLLRPLILQLRPMSKFQVLHTLCNSHYFGNLESSNWFGHSNTTVSSKKRKNAEKTKLTTETLPSTTAPVKKRKRAEKTKMKTKAPGPSTTMLATKKPTNNENSEPTTEEPKSRTMDSVCTPTPTALANVSTSVPKLKNPDVPYSSTRQERMRRKKAPNAPQPLSYTKRADFQRLQHDLKLHKSKHGNIQIASLTPQPTAMTQLKRYLKRHQAKVVLKFLSKYKPETAKQRVARKENKANSASEKLTESLLTDDLDGEQGNGDEGNIDRDTKKDELEDNENKENEDQSTNNGENNDEAHQEARRENKHYFLKHAIGHVAALVDAQEAPLVVIASDVQPTESVAWLPNLCRRKKVPFLVIREKMRLGSLVYKKASPVVALTAVRTEHKVQFARVLEIARKR
ncbi:60S ribosomal protein L7A [Podila verticillata]|nr:60S ribosomal protein L7A [Podila verticillata]